MSTRIFQKTSAILAKMSFIAAIVCGAFLMFSDLANDEIYRASFGASAFFFCAVAIVLQAVAATNLPSFKPDNDTAHHNDSELDKTEINKTNNN